MYTRYIPQSDGSFQRSYVPDAPKKPAPPPEPPREEPRPQPAPPQRRPQPPQRPRPQPCQKTEGSVSGFLRQLLPRGFDTGDLLVVVLLLLMAGDCPEDQNTALLTLALYLFL